jgi:hypothetical protein
MDDSSIFSVHAGNKSKTIKCGKSHKISLQRERGGGKFLGLNYIRPAASRVQKNIPGDCPVPA